MKKINLRVISLCLVALMLFGTVGDVLPVIHASAAVIKQPISGQIATIYQKTDAQPAQIRDVSLSVSNQDQAALEDAADALRQGIAVREPVIYVDVTLGAADPNEVWNLVWNMALAHTGEPKEGDYIAWHWSSYGGGYSGESWDGGMHLVLQYMITYYTDAAQEAELDAAVEALLNELDLWDATDYEKICGIYDYLCHNISYDYDNLEDDSYTLKFSAYAAMINKTSVCQGYALLFYRLALELGVDARVITGLGYGGGHAWNIVKIGDWYYNLDATWDRSWYEAGLDYAWFLRGSEEFPDHVSDEEYLTAEFQTAYPISQTNYVPDGGQEPEPVPVIDLGACGNDLSWVLTEDGVLTIYGTGEMNNYTDWSPASWYSHRARITSVVIEDGVTTIGSYAFRGCYQMTDVTIGGSVVSIGKYAFYSCSALRDLEIPGSVTSIGMYAFSICGSLETVVIGNGVADIGDWAFRSCESLTSVTIPESVATFGKGVFGDCRSLTGIWVHENNPYFSSDDRGVLFNHDMTVLLQAPGGIHGAYSVPDGVVDIAGFAFQGCADLTGIIFSGSVTNIGTDAFDFCESLTHVTIPGNVVTIGESAFSSCSGLISVELQHGVASIAQEAFAWCSELESLTIADTVVSIGENAFYGCESLTTVTIPDSVTDLGKNVFASCCALLSVNIGDGIRAIPNGAFSNCSSLENVIFGANVTTIGEYAFASCTGLQNITIPETVTSVAYCAFTYCYGMTEIIFQGDAPSVGQYAFEEVTATAYYPAGNDTWTEAVMQNYGGTLTWVAYNTDPCAGGHSYEALITEPTCTAEGYTTYICSVCGDSYVDAYVPATDHSYGDWYVVTEPTCVTTGVKRHDCIHCDYFETEDVDMIDHDFDAVVTEPTCITDGYTTFTCSECGFHYVDHWVFAPGHYYENHVTEPTCTTDGYTTHTCVNCGDSYVDTYTAALDHDWDEGVVTVEPTEETAGQRLYTCRRCGETKTEEIPALEHTHSYEASVTEPTCTQEGYTTYTCRCGDSYVDAYVPATDHSYGDWYVVTEPTCVTTGVKRHDCIHCDYFETEDVDMIDHDFDAVVTEPTCITDGYTTFTCSECGFHYVDHWVFAPGHYYENHVTEPTCTTDGYTTHTCVNCGDSYVDTYTAALDHDWDEGVVTVEPTEETAGQRLYTCRRCGETKTEEIPALEHTHSYEASVTEPTCTQEGYTTYTCRCGDSYQTNFRDPLGHQYEAEYPLREGLCTDDYCVTYTCIRCGDSYFQWFPAPGHQYESVIIEPTCTEDGYTMYICSVCGEVYFDDYVAATGHSYVDGACEHCGEEDPNYVPPIQGPNGSYENPFIIDSLNITLTAEDDEVYYAWIATESGEIVIRVAECTWSFGYSLTINGQSLFGAGAELKVNVEVGDQIIIMIVVYPSATNDGYLTLEQVIEVPHEHEYLLTDAKAETCTEDGYATYTCECGDSYTVIHPAYGHQFAADDCPVVTAPTCTQEGYTTYTCPCGETYVTDFVPATGHSYVDGACEHCGEADPSAPAVLMGDANGDGVVNYLDAMLIAQYYVGDISADELNLEAADVNGDGIVNYLDAMMVAQFYVGDIDSFPADRD